MKLLFLIATLISIVAGTPLSQVAFIISHDAASGELISSRDFIVSDWAKTQSKGLVEQLKCGARALDYRPKLSKDIIYPHHGGVTIHKPMEESIAEIQAWCNDQSESRDLIILYLSHFDGDGCIDATKSLLTKMKVPYLSGDCKAIANTTYEEALAMATHNDTFSRQTLLAVFDCMEENYDPSVECYGKGYVCYEETSSIPFSHLKEHLQSVTNKSVDTYESTLWMAQAHWQSSAESIIEGTLHRSSLVLDETKSQTNAWVNNQIKLGEFKSMNFLELDEVCDEGINIYNTLRAIYPST